MSIFYALQLARSENVGAITFKTLIEFYKTPQNALKYIEQLSIKGGRKRPIKIATEKQVKKEIEDVKSFGGQIISIFDDIYPENLRNIYDAPPILTIKGNINLLKEKKFAIVGSRNASMASIKFAQKISHHIAKEGFITVSGLARGIDTAVHVSSIQQGTIAVVAGGIDFIYPPENKNLYNQICDIGLVISEAPLGAVPKAEHFPKRNRIISGLCTGVLVVEAALNSGSLITAKMAMEQGREVFAVPGSPLDIRCKGTNFLLKQGAILVEDVDDIIKNLSAPRKTADIIKLFEEEQNIFINQGFAESFLDEKRVELASLLSYSEISIFDLKKQLQIDSRILQILLVELELADKIIRHPNNKISLKP
jgi:DNA processing protein